MNKLLKRVLDSRNIVDEKDIEEFLSDTPQKTYDPFLLHGMKEAVGLLLDAINNNKRICIYGDYDADGITSISILMNVLSTLTDNITYYIPRRFKEGYGLNTKAIDKIIGDNVELIITVDCGIQSIKEVEYIKNHGIDVIITDHHTPGENIPDTIVINPKQANCNYPFKELAGCGVAFKLAQAVQRQLGLDKSNINNVLDILAIGTVGDIVSLTDENRTIVKYGLRQLAKTKHIGLKVLIKRLGLDINDVKSEDISFKITPHLNATGRMKEATLGVRLLLSNSEDEANILVDEIIELNNERRAIQTDLLNEAYIEYQSKYINDKFPFIILDNAHEGITGIVASQLKDMVNKPIALLTPDDENLKATSRATDDVHLFNLFNEYAHLFEKMGGHKAASGFTISRNNLAILRENIEALDNLANVDDTVMSNFDLEIFMNDISVDDVESLNLLEPYGAGNEKPLFKVSLDNNIDIIKIGKEKKHIRFQHNDYKKDGLEFVYFNVKQSDESKLKNNYNSDIIGILNINTWRNKKKIQMLVKDIL
ncbi:MAG: single-stranded-DNA-specific exonuclease RecJ [Eubacteriales bacterium]|nr:single-stranded-DNA-specific exonuclease RecJ [Eubacteriales bacterium]MDY3333061.1 single-stranded-DNA-specific exonuclease RecJ [Gallibacter sp.]